MSVLESQKDIGASTKAAAELRQRILAGSLKPGTPLREIALISDLGISRNTLRQAFLQLTLEGLTEQQLYKGTVVRTIEEFEIRDIFIARRTFELRAIEMSSFAAPEAIREIKVAVDRSQHFVDIGAWVDAATAGIEFHQKIVTLLGSPRLDAMFEILCAQMRLAFSTFVDQAAHQAPWLEWDREIYNDIVGGQRRKASLSLEKYLNESEQQLLDATRATRVVQA